MRDWFRSGQPWVWLNAAAVSASILMVVGLLLLIAVRGLGHFWPASVVQVHYQAQPDKVQTLLGEINDVETVPASRIHEAGVVLESELLNINRVLLKIGNRDIYGLDFRWLLEPLISERQTPSDVVVIERTEWGNFYGFVQAIKEHGELVSADDVWSELQERLQRVELLNHKIRTIEKGQIGRINYAKEKIRLAKRKLALKGISEGAALDELIAADAELDQQYQQLQEQLVALQQDNRRDAVVVQDAAGRQVELALANIVRAYRPNTMSLAKKTGFYLSKLWEFVSDEPREANTEGGIFPAIFGTVMMVIIMSILVTPFGVVAAIYLREYAKQGFITRLIRIAVNNLAGVPSIVYGVFGLGFFVYFLGGSIDQLLFPAALPAPTFGTPGLLWASLTLALLTVPVVIVATEEGLSRIPRSIREGSMALGATKAETLWRTVLPMASPAMMTGLILAVARAAGEVAPLMLVGVVKLAPALPVDLNMPFVHLERKFMHLGFHIYDVGFQSPNVEAARPLVYATALLLVVVIVILNLSAIAIRNRLRERYRALES